MSRLDRFFGPKFVVERLVREGDQLTVLPIQILGVGDKRSLQTTPTFRHTTFDPFRYRRQRNYEDSYTMTVNVERTPTTHLTGLGYISDLLNLSRLIPVNRKTQVELITEDPRADGTTRRELHGGRVTVASSESDAYIIHRLNPLQSIYATLAPRAALERIAKRDAPWLQGELAATTVAVHIARR